MGGVLPIDLPSPQGGRGLKTLIFGVFSPRDPKIRIRLDESFRFRSPSSKLKPPRAVLKGFTEKMAATWQFFRWDFYGGGPLLHSRPRLTTPWFGWAVGNALKSH